MSPSLNYVWSTLRVLVNRNYYTKVFGGRLAASPWLRDNRLYNYLHFKRALRRIQEASGSAPQCLHVETTSVCNARCVMCAYPVMERAKGYMDMDLFQKIVDEAAKIGVQMINLQFYGEPLLDQKLFERIRYIKEKTLKVKFNTNASLLSEERARLIIETRVDEINLSFDAFTKETYEKIRIGLKYDKVIGNMERLIRLKRELGSPYPLIRLLYVNFQQNANEAKLFYDYWHGKADEVVITYARDWAGQLTVLGEGSPHLAPRLPSKNPCDSLWKDMVVGFDGQVVLCCADYDGKQEMGNLQRQSIMEVWNGPVFQKYRESHLKDERDQLNLCGQCSKYSVWW